MVTRITPKWISELNDNEIFVFGSNMSGRHGKGAAKTAMKWGAVYGQSDGLQGRTYGIPTVNASISNKLSIEKISIFVCRFIEFAKSRPDLKFLVTDIGCGLAGHNAKKISPLFSKARDVKNIYLPRCFRLS